VAALALIYLPLARAHWLPLPYSDKELARLGVAVWM